MKVLRWFLPISLHFLLSAQNLLHFMKFKSLRQDVIQQVEKATARGHSGDFIPCLRPDRFEETGRCFQLLGVYAVYVSMKFIIKVWQEHKPNSLQCLAGSSFGQQKAGFRCLLWILLPLPFSAPCCGRISVNGINCGRYWMRTLRTSVCCCTVVGKARLSWHYL